MSENRTDSCCAPVNTDTCDAADPGHGHEPVRPERSTAGVLHHEESLVTIPGGTFLMGSEAPESFVADGEGPVREVTVQPYRIDSIAVTNSQFGEFVDAAGYVTDAERFGWSFVFHSLVSRLALKRGHVRPVPGLDWWLGVQGAGWRHPEGKGSNIRGRDSHPVVHVSWNDAAAYARWAGKRLPTETEWEYAARGGLEQRRYPWGDELTPGGRHMCNIWQGEFPLQNTADDGYQGTCPVTAFEPNGYGLYNCSGNVWEWCQDRWQPGESGRVTRGGSYLCHYSYCNRYRVAARTKNTPETSTGHTGFRCAADA